MKNSDCLKYSFIGMASSGVWVPIFFEEYPLKGLFLVYTAFFQGLVFPSVLLAEFFYLCQNYKETEKMVAAAVLFGTHLAELAKICVIWFRQDRIKKAIETIDGPYYTKTDDPEKKAILEGVVVMVTKINNYVIASVLISSLIYTTSYAFAGELPLRTVYPFDAHVYPRLPFMILYQSLTVVLLATSDASENVLVFGLMILAGAQLDALRYQLEHFNTQDKQNEDFPSTYLQAVDCVKHHQNIIEYVEELGSIFGPSIFVQLCSSSITICMTAFQMSKCNDFAELLRLMSYLSCVLVELFMYCYAGDQLHNKSLLISDAAYAGNWTDTDRKTRRILLMLSLRSQRPLSICVASLFFVSWPTAANVMKTGYSYFTMLQQTST